MITSYCPKCGRDFPLTDLCPECGKKLTKSNSRVAWCMEHTPVLDWMSWDSAFRLLVPCVLLILIVLLAGEFFSGGLPALQQMIRVGILPLLIFLLVCTLLIFLFLFLRGHDLVDCILDSKGIHVRTWLSDPTPLRLLLHFRSPSLLKERDPDTPQVLLISEKNVSWSDLKRIQLWPEKLIILFYAPAPWCRAAFYCTPYTWEDCMQFLQEKVGKKKTIVLPTELVAPKNP